MDQQTADPVHESPPDLDIAPDMFADAVMSELKAASPHSAAGRDGGRATHWQVGCGDDRFGQLLASALLRWLQGEAPAALDELLAAQSLFAIRKANGGIRPIAVGAFLRRLGLRAMLRCIRKETANAAGPAQYALGRAGGADAAFKALALEASSDDGVAVLSVDIKNAYGTVSRGSVQRAVRRRIPRLAGLVDMLMSSTVAGATDLPDGVVE